VELRSFVQKLVKQYRLTPNIAPQTYRCGGQLKLNPEQLLVLAELIEANNDATLEELRYLLYPKIGVAISRATMGRMTKLLGSDKYVVIRYSLAQNIVVIMNKIPNSTNMVF
jgi:transposase